MSVYLEGQKKGTGKGTAVGKVEDEGAGAEGGERNSSTAGGKGGGEWLFVSHDPLPTSGEGRGGGDGDEEKSWGGLFGLGNERCGGAAGEVVRRGGRDGESGVASQRLIHFKFEPMVSTSYTPLLWLDPHAKELVLDSPRPDGVTSTCPAHSPSRYGGWIP